MWAESVKEARARVGRALVKEGLVPTQSLLPTLDVAFTGHSRPGRYDYDGNAVDGYRDQPAKTERRYAVDVRV